MKAVCSVCSKEINRPPSHLARAVAPVCSRSCNGKNRAATLVKYSGNMKGRKRQDLKFGAANPGWKGGSYMEPGKGYRMVRAQGHPRARKNGYVLEHILVAEKMLGRPLKPGEEVHHLNRDRADNRPENLQVFCSHSEHWALHYPDVARARDAAKSRRSTKGGARR